MSPCRHALLIAIFAVLPFANFAVPPDREKPPVELASASLQLGSTPRVPAQSWATWNFAVRNTSDMPVTVDLALNAIGGRSSAVHQSRLSIPAGFTLGSSAPVLLDNTERYETSLYVAGNKVDYTESMLRVLSSNKHLAWIVNDDEEMALGQIARNENLHKDFETVYCGADKLPRHWAGFADVHTLVMLRPNYVELSSHSIIAIERWVARGGTLIFIDPGGILEASEGPLSELLPIVPMRLRKLETLDALSAIGGGSITWPAGIDFLESAPKAHSISTLVQGDYPIAHWRRHHLGTVGVTLINPGTDGLRNTPDFDRLWRHLLAFGDGLKPASATASRQLDNSLRLLTGISIPEASVIRRVVLGYLIVVLVAVGAGYVCRRRLLIWAGLAVVALLTTIVIFRVANTRGERKSEDLASVVRIEPAGAALAGCDQLTAIFSRSEKTVDVNTRNIDQRLRARMDLGFSGLRSQGDSGASRRKDKGPSRGISDVLKVSAIDSTMNLDDQLLRQAALLQYSCETNAPSQAPIVPPSIDWQSPAVLSAWQTPDALANPLTAFIACEGGIIPVQSKGRQLDLGGSAVLSPDLQNLRDFFRLSNHQLPALALVHDTDTGDAIPDGFAIHGKRISLLPLRQTVGETVHLPPSRIRISASAPGARRLRFRGEWQPLHQSNTSTIAIFDAWLPAVYSQMTPGRITISFRAENRGQNIRTSVAVAPFDATAPAFESSRAKRQERSALETAAEFAILPTRIEGDNYYFEELPENLRDPSDGLFRVVIIAEPIKRLPPDQALRANTWEVRELGISVSGSLPPHIRGNF